MLAMPLFDAVSWSDRVCMQPLQLTGALVCTQMPLTYTLYIFIFMYTIVYEHVEHVDRFFGAEKELERQHEEMLELQRGLPLMRSRLEAVGMFATQSCLS